MYITCLDLEGVLMPEIWIAFASISSMPFEGPPFISNMRAISRGSMLSSACAASAPKPSKW